MSDFHWLGMACNITEGVLQVNVSLQFADRPNVPADYPWPCQSAADNRGNWRTMPLTSDYLVLRSQQRIYSVVPMPEASQPYTLDLLIDDSNKLLAEAEGWEALLTEQGDALLTEQGDALGLGNNLSEALAPLCSEAGWLRNTHNVYNFITLGDWFLIRAEIPWFAGEPGAPGFLGQIQLYYVQSANLPIYAERMGVLWGSASNNLTSLLSYLRAVVQTARDTLAQAHTEIIT